MTPTGNGLALSDELIARCGDRAAGYDRENRFFTEDFEELRGAGYLKMAVPTELGGHGMSLADVCREQRRLAYRAPATALATNVVDLAMSVSGGGGMFKVNELERLYRDARCGGFHPANSILVHEIVGKTVLGIDLGEQPRWG